MRWIDERNRDDEVNPEDQLAGLVSLVWMTAIRLDKYSLVITISPLQTSPSFPRAWLGLDFPSGGGTCGILTWLTTAQLFSSSAVDPWTLNFSHGDP